MASIYDEEDKKQALIMGLLGMSLPLLGARRGNEGQAFAQAGLLGLGGYSRALEGATEARDRKMQREMQAQQWAQQQQEYARKMQEQKAMEQARLQSFTGGSPQMGPPTQGGEMQPPVAPQFSREAYADNLEAVNPQAGMTYRQLIAKPTRELKDTKTLMQNGQRVTVNLFKDGTSEIVPYSPEPEKPHFVNTGQRVGVPLDPWTGKALGEGVQASVDPNTQYAGNITLRGQNLTDARALAAQGNALQGRTDDLRKEFNSLPQVKAYGEVQPVIQSSREAMGTDTAAADLNLIYAAAKIFDPTSVVRESETTMVMNSGSPSQRFLGQFNYVAGGGRLTPKARAQLMAQIESRARGYEAGYTSARKAYSAVAAKQGIAPEDVFIEPFASGTPTPPAAPKPTGATYETAEPGEIYTAPDGTKRRKR